MVKNVKFVIIKSKFYQYFVFTKKSTPQICLILHQFNRYVLLICGKGIGDENDRRRKLLHQVVRHDE